MKHYLLGMTLVAGLLDARVAGAGDLTLQLIGERGAADPHFVAMVGGTEVGSGEITPAIDTAAGQRLSTTVDPAQLERSFSFAIPAAVFNPTAAIAVELTNDSGDKATGADTNLFIVSASIDGKAVDLANGHVEDSSGKPKPLSFTKGAVAIFWNATATFPAPAGGWPAACRRRDLAITGFANGDESLTAAARTRIAAFAQQSPGSACRIEIVGYASDAGDPALNQAVSEARAQAVSAYLDLEKLCFASKKVSAFGGTSQFGEGPANRRVTLTIGP